MMKLTLIGLLLCLSVTHLGVAFEEVDQTAPSLDFSTLTLAQASAFALEHAPAIQEAELTVALAQLDLKGTQLWRQLIPSLTLSHGYNPIVGENRVGVGLSFSLNEIFAENERAKAAKLRWFNHKAYQKTVRNRVIIAVTQSYYDLVAAKKQVELLEDQLSTQLKLSELQKIQFESGSGGLNPLLSTMQTIATTQLALLRAQAQVHLQELKLKGEIGFDEGE